jgi:hypothetical protein
MLGGMKSVITALVLTAVSAFGMAKKPKVTVRFHAETNPNDTSTFSMPARLLYQQREATLNRVPVVSERDIKAIFPFKTADGTWGCVFQFDEQGRIRLEAMSSSQQGTALVLYIATKGGQHQVADWRVDRPVTTGRITLQRGLSDLEVLVMKQQFKVLGEETAAEKKRREKEEREQKKKKGDVTDWTIDRKRDDARPGVPDAAGPGAPKRKAPPLPQRRELRELDTPRVGD